MIELIDVTVASSRQTDEAEIEGVQWAVEPGQFWVIGGLRGKSDFLATVAGLQKPLRGRVKWFGRELAVLSEQELVSERMKVGMVFEGSGRLFRHLTVAENVALPLRYHHNYPEDDMLRMVQSVLELTELMPVAHQTPGALSVGMQQCAALARALVLKPRVLLVDKPFISLRHLRWWQDIFQKVSRGASFNQNQPVTLVITSDDIGPWLDYGTHFALLREHRWQMVGDRNAARRLHPTLHAALSEAQGGSGRI